MKKNILHSFAVLLLLLAAPVALIGCPPQDGAHVHSPGR